MTEKICIPAAEAAELLSIGRSTFWQAVKDGKLPQPIKIGGSTRWLVSDLLQHAQASRPTTASSAGAAEGTQPGYTQP